MQPTPVIAIIDIGKTNKKILLFDEDYKLVFEETKVITEIVDEDNFPCEDLDSLITFVTESLNKVLHKKEFDVRAINFSAYGASFVHLNDEGRPVTPLYNYLKPYPEELKKIFYQSYGGEKDFAKITASPVLGNLNSGMQLYFLKHAKPEKFNQIKYSIHLPQYISYIISGNIASDITSIGCHTNLWDFKKNEYHSWVNDENVIKKLAPVTECTKTITATFQKRTFKAGIGLHDSSAALIPYLLTIHKPFALISTGTWCITLNPFTEEPLTQDELQEDCLCYLSYTGKPIKASRIFAGNEHEMQVKKIALHFNRNINDWNSIKYNPDIVSNLESGNKKFTQESKHLKQSFFSHRSLHDFTTYEEAYHQLIMDIIDQQYSSTELIIKGSDVKQIFVDGGFSKNDLYMNLLAKAFNGFEVFAASMSNGTALGAALVIHKSWNSKPFPIDIIAFKNYTR